MIYLYKKTHRVTGLQYLGKTSRTDPYTYPGSGKRWRSHLDKHGYEFDTEILFESENPSEISKMGLHYSKLWNVVDDNNWANLKPESEDGGTFSHTAEAKKKIGDASRGKISWHNGKTYEEIQKDPNKALLRKQKHSKLMREQNSFQGKSHSEDTKRNMSLKKKGKTWEEIYGIDGANKRREDFKLRKLNKTKGL
jgi:hypothetical protein